MVINNNRVWSINRLTRLISLFCNDLAYGYERDKIVINPMFKSRSPSDFWGRRRNTIVHHGLKNGAYKPVSKFTNTRTMSVLASFVVSGVIHEYVNLVL